MEVDPVGSPAPLVRVAADVDDDGPDSYGEGEVSQSSPPPPPHHMAGARGSRLQVPYEQYGGPQRNSFVGPLSAETLFEEESDLIRSCGALSSVLGLRRSFSLFDISADAAEPLRACASEIALGTGGGGSAGVSGDRCCIGGRDDVLGGTGCRLDYASRSCSTWVAVGDMASTSQLPSPQGPPGGEQAPTITAADFVRSVNKKLRQTYIRRRLLTTYKALERVSPSELNLQAMGRAELAALGRVSQSQLSREILRLLRREQPDAGGSTSSTAGLLGAARSLNLTARDVERDKGKPLTKYERNMMIFNWLHSLDESPLDRMS